MTNTNTNTKYVQLDDWFFEVKMVRAIKVDEYGKPYNVVANCTVNGDTLYIDGMLAANEENFNRKDFVTFYKFCQKLGLNKAVYDRYINGEMVKKEVLISPEKPTVNLENELIETELQRKGLLTFCRYYLRAAYERKIRARKAVASLFVRN
jgi:hypothetical protein